tara:strand:- start:269 stop:1267 length:999 start_codon:yes stop_codon:yes gene_type:complete
MKYIKNTTILVTGADGFIGSHLVENLVKNNLKVRAFVYYNSWNNLGWLNDLDQNILNEIEIFHGDIRDQTRVFEAVKGCEYIFHLSSLIGIPYSYIAPDSYIDTNVKGTLNILNACKKSDVFVKLMHTSTSEVYGTAQKIPIDENHPLVGQSPYSASKIAADKLVESYNLSFGLPVITARPFNTYGPRQTARAVIPTIIFQLLTNKKNINLGSLAPTRDFNYVKDTIEAMITLAFSKNLDGEVFNIGTGKETSIYELVKILMDITGNKVEIENDNKRHRPAKSEVQRLIADTKKIEHATGWKPNFILKQGLNHTVNWAKENLHLFDENQYFI